ncbi:hypothetical protein BO70DRAFT_3702 [Aspergillus heteromorphus CBS 117.55]|uniref:Uncharacterized protein n=1 Tax=Aspergillus heteromorphus CBS 117.55 TaxID=1448321 RepID=A0A317X3D5_9EURO|nr:uncharacterized protein BO70DRAFT_3702 [Aspergillus heteromorphus CBS 117.55]PWY92132.1 hypothetical protein BO70DRAFT_3702 [Aspergillus heteromorphus CBS 117.55]
MIGSNNNNGCIIPLSDPDRSQLPKDDFLFSSCPPPTTGRPPQHSIQFTTTTTTTIVDRRMLSFWANADRREEGYALIMFRTQTSGGGLIAIPHDFKWVMGWFRVYSPLLGWGMIMMMILRGETSSSLKK